MLNKTFFTDIEHKDKYFRHFIEDVVMRYPLEAKEVSEEDVFVSLWHGKVNYSSGSILGF